MTIKDMIEKRAKMWETAKNFVENVNASSEVKKVITAVDFNGYASSFSYTLNLNVLAYFVSCFISF